MQDMCQKVLQYARGLNQIVQQEAQQEVRELALTASHSDTLSAKRKWAWPALCRTVCQSLSSCLAAALASAFDKINLQKKCRRKRTLCRNIHIAFTFTVAVAVGVEFGFVCGSYALTGHKANAAKMAK